jgi:hypothetical protein
MKYVEFYERICALPDKYKNRDLEAYLSALYSLTEKHGAEEMTDELFFQLLAGAFVEKPIEFQKEWLDCNAPPHDNGLIRKFTNPEFKDDLDRTFHSTEEGVEFTLGVLTFQIAELHKMRKKQLKDTYRYFGINSETGHRWYNFDPFTNLECGARCMADNVDDENDEMNIGWETLGELLEDGRIYE